MQNAECEWVATNIMKILARTGDEFRPITLEEYKAERMKDVEAGTDKGGGWSYMEASIFERVSNCAKSAELASKFCKDWETALRKK